MSSFTPWSSLAGGAAIGLAATLLLAGNGRLAGISTIFGGLLHAPTGPNTWRWLFTAGLVAGGALMGLVQPELFATSAPRALWVVGVAGLLVGFGTRLGGGCTSGHGICGNAKLSVRSLVATVTFMITGAVAVAVAARLGAVP